MDLRARLRTGKQRIELFCLLILVSVVFDNGVRVGWVMRMSVEVAVDELRMVSVRGLSYMEMLGRQQSQAQNTQHWQAGEDATQGATFFCHKGIHYRGRSRSSQISGREAICVFTREMCVVGDVIDWRGLFPVTLAPKQLECRTHYRTIQFARSPTASPGRHNVGRYNVIIRRRQLPLPTVPATPPH